MSIVFLGIGLVLVIEGLVLALAPLRFEDIVKMLAELPAERRRVMGLIALAIGVLFVWLSKSFGGLSS